MTRLGMSSLAKRGLRGKKRSVGPTKARQRVVGPTKQFASITANAGRRLSRNVLFREKSEHQQEADLQQGQMRAELIRNRESRTIERRELMETNKHDIEKIKEELKRIIKRFKEQTGIRRRFIIENDMILERLAINLFKSVEGKMEFITAKNPLKQNAFENMLNGVENTMIDMRVVPSRISEMQAENIEGTINQSIQQTFEQLQQQGQM